MRSTTSERAALLGLAVSSAVLLVACGSSPPRESARSSAPERAAAQPADPSADPPVEDAVAASVDAPCAQLADCGSARGRCVWDGACREPSDECEAVAPQPSWNGAPVFSEGDPCENARPGCAWSTDLRRCVPFVPVAVCPATLQEAQTAAVLCNHSSQAQLDCAYVQTHCTCVAQHYCGGAPPPPTMTPFPQIFVCTPPVDERGCPTGAIRAGGRCDVDSSVSCGHECGPTAQCLRGRWRVYPISPRP